MELFIYLFVLTVVGILPIFAAFLLIDLVVNFISNHETKKRVPYRGRGA